MINHKYKFAYFGAGKCASSSIIDVLNKVPGGEGGQHCTIIDLYQKRKPSKIPSDYFTFSFCRNPFDRLVSAWNEFKKKDQFLWAKNSRYWEKEIFKSSKLSLENVSDNFPAFARYITIQDHIHWCQFDILSNIVRIDFIGKTESLQEDFNTVCNKIGISQQTLSQKNKTQHKHYTEYYDDETREIVAEKYAKDIEHFGYKFGK